MKISDSEGSYMDSYEADYTNGDDIFADIHNLDHCIKYLNQSLITFGFPSGLNLFSSDPVSIAKTCNCIYAMIQQRQRDIEYRETANDTRQRLMSDMSRLEIKMERLSDQLGIKEREMQAMASKEQKVTTTFKTQLEKLQLEKDEFQRMLITSQQVRSQQNHELKKKEKEYVKLQERLNQVLMEKKKESKNGIDIMNLLQKEGRQRGTWNSKKADGDFYKMIVDAYESKKQELVAENADLRALLRSMQADMRDFLNTSNVIGRPGSVANGSADLEPPPTPLGGRTDIFDLPFHMAKDEIEQSLRAKMSSIKERIIQLQGQNGGQTGVFSARELQLEEQLAEACNVINEQATLMTRHVPDSGANSVNSKELQQSTEDNSFLSEETTGVQDHRNANIEASRDLSRERTELAKAQQKLAEEQASWASAVTSMAPNLRGHPGLLDSKKQDEPEVAIACRESLINYKEPAESRTTTISRESFRPGILDIPVEFQISEVESPLITELADLLPRVKYHENPWLDPLIWEKICAPIENLSSQEDHCVHLNNQELKRAALDLESSSMWPKFSFGGLCDPPRFESYEEFEHWIARSAFGGRHDETMVVLQRTQTVAIGSTVSNSESRFTEMA